VCRHTLADLALQVGEAILDKAQPNRERGGAPDKVPGDTPLPTKFYRSDGTAGGSMSFLSRRKGTGTIALLQGSLRLVACPPDCTRRRRHAWTVSWQACFGSWEFMVGISINTVTA